MPNKVGFLLYVPWVVPRVIPVVILAAVLAAPLLGCVAIDADQITGGDLAQANPVFAALDVRLPVSPAPLAGAVRVMHPDELAAIARRFGVAARGPLGRLEDACFERSSEVLTEGRLQPILRGELGAGDGAGLRILDFSPARIPRGARIEFPRANLTPSGLWRGWALSANRSVALWVKVSWVKVEGIKSEGPGMAPVRGGAADPRVLPLFPRPDSGAVERGQRVAVEVRSGGARVAFEARAESGGRKGELVLLRNPENGRLFQAQVQGRGIVLVQR